MREFQMFQQHATFVQTSTQEQLQNMATRLQQQLRSRSGLFQYGDLSDVAPPETVSTENPIRDHDATSPQEEQNIQPEEEPLRRKSEILALDAQRLAEAQNTPVPDSPRSNPPEAESMSGTDEVSQTEPMQTDNEDASSINMEPVYNVKILENHDYCDVIVEDQGSCWTHVDPRKETCAQLTFDVPQQQLSRFLQQPAEHLPCLIAAAQKSRSEVTYSELSKSEQELFQGAKQKELQCWLDTNTVKAIARDRIHPSRILASRWILTWKEDPQSMSGRKPKARLVVKGFQDPDIGVLSSDSPTLTRDARMILLQAIASFQWVVQSFDITTAFLRGKSDQRELAMEAPPELKKLLGMDQSQVCLLQGNAYGRVDAPLLFYKEFRKKLEKVGFQVRPLDNCLFLLRNPHNPKKLDGILGTHVDDGIGGGNENFEKALQKLQQSCLLEVENTESSSLQVWMLNSYPTFQLKSIKKNTCTKLHPSKFPKLEDLRITVP